PYDLARLASLDSDSVSRPTRSVGRQVQRWGVSVWLEAANRRLPVATIVTTRALPMLVPSFACDPSTAISSPTFMVFRVQPWRMRPFGLPISIPQLTVLPSAPDTSMKKYVWGFCHSILVTMPLRVSGLVASNSAANE